MNVLITCKNQEDPIKIEGARVLTTVSSSLTVAGLSVAMETRVLV